MEETRRRFRSEALYLFKFRPLLLEAVGLEPGRGFKLYFNRIKPPEVGFRQQHCALPTTNFCS